MCTRMATLVAVQYEGAFFSITWSTYSWLPLDPEQYSTCSDSRHANSLSLSMRRSQSQSQSPAVGREKQFHIAHFVPNSMTLIGFHSSTLPLVSPIRVEPSMASVEILKEE